MLNNYSTFRSDSCNCDDVNPKDKGYVYHNPILGLITLSSNGFNWITIADKNLGATEVWHPGDPNTPENIGKFYQRGNCYPRPPQEASQQTFDKYDASGYGPGNIFSRNMFIKSSINHSNYWDSSDNMNLWGGGGDKEYYMFDNKNDRSVRRAMCNEGQHIPSGGELIKLLKELIKIDNILNEKETTLDRIEDFTPYTFCIIYKASETTDLNKYILAPKVGGISNRTGKYETGGSSFYSSTIVEKVQAGHYCHAIRLALGVSSINAVGTALACSGMSVRPFNDESFKPDDEWIKLY